MLDTTVGTRMRTTINTILEVANTHITTTTTTTMFLNDRIRPYQPIKTDAKDKERVMFNMNIKEGAKDATEAQAVTMKVLLNMAVVEIEEVTVFLTVAEVHKETDEVIAVFHLLTEPRQVNLLART